MANTETDYAYKTLYVDFNYQDSFYSQRIEHRLVKIPRPIKIKHPLTKATKIFGNLMLMYQNETHFPDLISGIEVMDEAKCKKFGLLECNTEVFPHPNVNLSPMDCLIYSGEKTKEPIAKLKVNNFCNPVNAGALWNNLDNLFYLTNQLEKYTFSDAFNQALKEHIDFDLKERIVKCARCSTIMNPEKTTAIEYATKRCSGCIQANKDVIMREFQQLVKREPNNMFFKVGKNNNYHYDSKENFEIYSAGGEISAHYPILDMEEIMKTADALPNQEMDMCIMGLGSAGSGLIDQIGRTQILNKYTLIDFDSVENKNLRNQLYTSRDVGGYKSEQMAEIMRRMRSNTTGLTIKHFNRKFETVDSFSYTDFKYTLLGFDTIKTRFKALTDILSSKINTKYIMDTRYDGLTASVYMVDRENSDEVEYYKECLLQDGEALEHEEKDDEWKDIDINNPNFMALVREYDPQHGGCSRFCTDVVRCQDPNSGRGIQLCHLPVSERCGQARTDCSGFDTDCLPAMVAYMNKHQRPYKGANDVNNITCTAWNIIDIYKFASTFLTSAIRDIEEGKPKPFTHIEVSTDGLPQSMVYKS